MFESNTAEKSFSSIKKNYYKISKEFLKKVLSIANFIKQDEIKVEFSTLVVA
jgi:hypothetical protein